MSANTFDTSSFYDRVHEQWGDLELSNPAAFHRRRWIVKLARQHALSARQVLEVGCGLGTLLKKLEIELPSSVVHGADVSETSLSAARLACPHAELFHIDLSDAHFEAKHREQLGRFDLVICSEVLEHLADDLTAAARMRALLAPGGHLIVSVPGGSPNRFDQSIGHLRHYSRARLTQLLTDAGYEVERVTSWGFPFHSLYRLVVHVGARFSLAESGNLNVPRAPVALGYRTLGALLKPLYYLNRPCLGNQLFAVARRR